MAPAPPPPPFLHQDIPLFSGLSHFLAKVLVPSPIPKWGRGFQLWKTASGALQCDPYCPSKDLIVIKISTKNSKIQKQKFQGFYQVFIEGSYFFLFQKSLRNLNHRQYGLTYIIHLENIDQLLSKTHIANSNQDKIQIETYCPFKGYTYISIKSSFLLIEIFLKNF